jgi:hypothetical protein
MFRTLFADSGRVLSRRVWPPLWSKRFHSRLKCRGPISVSGMLNSAESRYNTCSRYRSTVLGASFSSACRRRNSSISIDSVSGAPRPRRRRPSPEYTFALPQCAACARHLPLRAWWRSRTPWPGGDPGGQSLAGQTSSTRRSRTYICVYGLALVQHCYLGLAFKSSASRAISCTVMRLLGELETTSDGCPESRFMTYLSERIILGLNGCSDCT